MKHIYLTFLLLCSMLLPVYAQDEQEIITFQYQSLNQAWVFNDSYEELNDISINVRTYALTFNYGHSLGNSTSDIVYSVSYQNYNQAEDVSGVDFSGALSTIPKSYYEIPQFSQISVSSGLSKPIGKGWQGVSLFTLYVQGDLFKPELQENVSWGNMTYFEKSGGEHLTYGFGVYLNQLKNRFLVAPWVNIRWANANRGVELLFPQKVKVWHRIMKRSSIELHAAMDSYALKYSSSNPVESTDIFSLKTGLAYHYLWVDWLRVNVGIDLPLNYYEVKAHGETFSYTQKNGLVFNTGISLIIPNE